MSALVDFVGSLGLIGYVVIAIVILLLINIRKIVKLKSPLDSVQHTGWKWSGETLNPDHLNEKHMRKQRDGKA